MSHIATVWAYQQRVGNPAAKAVLVALADKASDDGTCFPGQKRIAGMTELSLKSVERHVAALERMGLLSRARRHLKDGRRTSDSYVLALGQAFIVATDQVLADSVTTSQSVASEREPSDSLTTSQSDYKSDSPTTTRLSDGGSTSYLNRQKNEPSDKNTSAGRASVVAAAFDQFWQAYPIKLGKADARKAWDKATRTTDPDVVIAGAERYRDDPNRDPAHTKWAQGWLNGQRWDDDPLPAPREPRAPSDQRAQRNLALIDHYAEQERKALS